MGWDLTARRGPSSPPASRTASELGRFAGACVMAHVGRPAEPVVFRRWYFMCLDVWGDAGGVYVRAHNKAMPSTPDAVFEDCTLVGAGQRLAGRLPRLRGLQRVRFRNCAAHRAELLPAAMARRPPASSTATWQASSCTSISRTAPSWATRCSAPRNDDLFSYPPPAPTAPTSNTVKPVPKGFERLRFWPVEVFDELLRPRFQAARGRRPAQADEAALRHRPEAMENTPVVFHGPAPARPQPPRRHQEQHRRLHARACTSTSWTWPRARRWRRFGGAIPSPTRSWRRRAPRLRQRRHRPRLVPEPLPFLDHRPEDLEARAGHPAGGRRAPVQRLGLP